MPFYESVHCGVWRVQLNTQYLWQWLRENNIVVQAYGGIDVGRLAYRVEDVLNTQTFRTTINVNDIIKTEYQNMIKSNEK